MSKAENIFRLNRVPPPVERCVVWQRDAKSAGAGYTRAELLNLTIAKPSKSSATIPTTIIKKNILQTTRFSQATKSKTIRIGKVPIKLRFEPQSSLIQPDDIGSRWNFLIQITPVIPSPFAK